jgi:hypothetical protein
MLKRTRDGLGLVPSAKKVKSPIFTNYVPSIVTDAIKTAQLLLLKFDEVNNTYLSKLSEIESVFAQLLSKEGMVNKTYRDESIYHGDIDKDFRHGIGSYNYVEGSKYNGEWAYDLRHGIGQNVFPSGSKRGHYNPRCVSWDLGQW